MNNTLIHTIQSTTQELLRRAAIFRPPVNPRTIALSMNVCIEGIVLPRNAPVFKEKDATIVINRNDRMEIQNLTICRELARIVIPQGLDPDTEDDWVEEMAAEILVPAAWFRISGQQCDWDLAVLKEVFATACWELIARKMLRFHACVVTYTDNGVVKFREGSKGMDFPDRLLDQEYQAWEQAVEGQRPVELIDNTCRVRAWPVFDEGQRRVMVMAEIGGEKIARRCRRS